MYVCVIANYVYQGLKNFYLQLAKPEPNMFKILPIVPSALPKKFAHYSYFILPIIPIVFFSINISGTYWHLEKQAKNSVFCRYLVQILVIQVNGQWKLSSPFFKLTHLSCHCLPLTLISNRYRLFFNTFECPIILKICL